MWAIRKAHLDAVWSVCLCVGHNGVQIICTVLQIQNLARITYDLCKSLPDAKPTVNQKRPFEEEARVGLNSYVFIR